MSGQELHLEIIGLAEPNEAGILHFSEDNARRLLARFCEALEQPGFQVAVEGFVRAVAAFRAAGHPEIATQLMNLGTEAAEEVAAKNAVPAEKLKGAVTGADNLARMRPVGSGPAPKGALKATAFIRPLPKQR